MIRFETVSRKPAPYVGTEWRVEWIDRISDSSTSRASFCLETAALCHILPDFDQAGQGYRMPFLRFEWLVLFLILPWLLLISFLLIVVSVLCLSWSLSVFAPLSVTFLLWLYKETHTNLPMYFPFFPAQQCSECLNLWLSPKSVSTPILLRILCQPQLYVCS